MAKRTPLRIPLDFDTTVRALLGTPPPPPEVKGSRAAKPQAPKRKAAATASKALARTRQAKKEFDAAHEAGMKALKRGDYEGLGDAVDTERKAIESLPTGKRKAAKKR